MLQGTMVTVMGCKSPVTEPEITRTFQITVGGKSITVKDMRTGANDQTLETLGIIDALKTELDNAKSHPNLMKYLDAPIL